jgi:iron complex transport system substrate-binding protein
MVGQGTGLRRRIRLAASCVLLAWLAWTDLTGATHAAEPPITDDTGRTVELRAPASRIISLAPHITELLFLLGAGDRVIGTVAYSDHPEAARKVPRIGDAHAIDLERILALRPDLVVAWQSGNPRSQVEHVARLGIPVYRTEPRSLDDIAGSLIALGRLSGQAAEGKTQAARYRERLAGLRVQHRGAAPVTVFYQVWSRPLLTVSGNHVIGDALRLCGASNVFGTLTPLISTVDVEAVIAANPRAIVTGVARGETDDPFALWRTWTGLDAVQNRHLFVVPTEAMHRHTPRILDAVEVLCDQLEATRRTPSAILRGRGAGSE